MARVYIGIGSNLGDREAYMLRAVSIMEDQGLAVLKKSSIMETEPVDYRDQPSFLNQIVLVETDRGPEELLKILQTIENLLGRDRTIPKGPRTIDLDILLYDRLVIDLPHLTIPHPGISGRFFIREHLIELDPDLADPITGKKYRLL